MHSMEYVFKYELYLLTTNKYVFKYELYLLTTNKYVFKYELYLLTTNKKNIWIWLFASSKQRIYFYFLLSMLRPI